MKLPNRKIKGKYYFVDDDNNIIREATEEEIEALEKSLILDAPDYKEQIVSAIRERYSVDDELAILRQRDSKPDEFAEYFAFVEGIKQGLKGEEVGENDG
jgi:hypothetical protein